jgi:hypothetical protein
MSATTAPTHASLRQIADWQLNPEINSTITVDLPRLQRGFVWEPSKIMDLWDSILRGFPIGSLLLTEIGEDGTTPAQAENRKFWLLDGQQRATSIAIGYHNPWTLREVPAGLWSLKNIPVLWLDLCPEKHSEDETKLFFPYLITQSHPWGYRQDGGVISWHERRNAMTAFKQSGWDDNYTTYPLTECFPWKSQLPVPMSILLECAADAESDDCDAYWQRILKLTAKNMPKAWKERYSEILAMGMPNALGMILKAIHKLSGYGIHLNILSQKAAANDAITPQDNSLLFVRLNTGGVTLGGEELIFSMFKSYFPDAKDAVEQAAVGFMAPSKLFGLIVRLVAAKNQRNKLSQPVTFRDFKRDLLTNESFKKDLQNFIQNDVGKLMKQAQSILSDPRFDFTLPEVVATRTINESPDVFLALLYWLQAGGTVAEGGEEHRRLLGRFTALSWFMPGNARQRHDALREWLQSAGEEVVENLWTASCLHPLFVRDESQIPVFPIPEHLGDFLLKGVMEAPEYDWESLGSSQPAHALWGHYDFLSEIQISDSEDQASEKNIEKRQQNFMLFLNQLWPCRQMLLFAQRGFIRDSFKAFGQWEFALKDTNCPWDWDHIYPSAYNRKNVNPKYRSWHHTIGNLRAEGLSENRGNGCNWPTKKLAGNTTEEGIRNRENSFISDPIWQDILTIDNHNEALRGDTGNSMCRIVLLRLADIYRNWCDELKIDQFMNEILNHSRS